MKTLRLHRGLLARLVVCSLAACSAGDTILALNVNSTDDVGLVDELRVTVTQQGKSAVNVTFAPPLKELDNDAGRAIQPSFYHRITLPDSWEEKSAEVAVQTRSPGGVAPLKAETTVQIEPGGAVAAFVDLERAKPDAALASDAATDASADASADAARNGDAGADAARNGDAGADAARNGQDASGRDGGDAAAADAATLRGDGG